MAGPPPFPPPGPRRGPPPPLPFQRPNDDLSWSYFFRNGAVPAPEATSTSTERKRRHTGVEPEAERRPYPYPTPNQNHHSFVGRRPSGASAVAGPAGGTSVNPVDLTTGTLPRRQQHHPFNMPLGRGPRHSGASMIGGIMVSGGSGGMRGSNLTGSESDIHLPNWQPDSEVDKCPVCNTDFSFFHRKHHCRKCGRVVCGACSPHRITIPKQYVVQPPGGLGSEAQTTASPTSTSPQGRDAASEGGEIVRVCNPCVPDPWTPNTSLDVPARPRAADARRTETLDETNRRRSLAPNFSLPPPRYSSTVARGRAQSDQLGPPNFTRNPLQSTNSYNRGPPLPAPGSGRLPHRYTQSTDGSNPLYQPAITPAPPAPQNLRREIREEDECPVCGIELLPIEAMREAHIRVCIADRSASAPPNQQPSISSSVASGSTPPLLPPTDDPLYAVARGRARALATMYRPRGMAVYRATEKDCVSEDGNAQECVICFEEFQPGDEMGRMECWCKFHRLCIRQWWDTKGTGACPTHQLHEE